MGEKCTFLFPNPLPTREGLGGRGLRGLGAGSSLFCARPGRRRADSQGPSWVSLRGGSGPPWDAPAVGEAGKWLPLATLGGLKTTSHPTRTHTTPTSTHSDSPASSNTLSCTLPLTHTHSHLPREHVNTGIITSIKYPHSNT